MTAYTVLIYQQLGASPELASQYFLAEFLFCLLNPIVGWFTDRGGPSARYVTIVAAFTIKATFLMFFALGRVRSVGMLFALGLPLHAVHAAAIATLNGALVARGGDGSGDTDVARSRQAAKLGWQTAGDFAASLASLGLAAAHVSAEGFFGLTAALNGVCAIATAIALPRRVPLATIAKPVDITPHDGSSILCDAAAATTTTGPIGLLGAGDSVPAFRRTEASTTPPTESNARSTVGAALAAVAVTLYMVPPTSVVASGSYIGRPHAVETWVLSANQVTSFVGALCGVAIMGRFNLPLRIAVPVGAAAAAAADLSSLSMYAIGGNASVPINGTLLDHTPIGLATLLVQPIVSSALSRVAILPILAIGAYAAEGRGEGAAYGLVSAADAAGGLVAGSLSTLAVHVLNLGEPPEHTWAPLPFFICACAAAKLLTAPFVLLMLRMRTRVLQSDADPDQCLRGLQ